MHGPDAVCRGAVCSPALRCTLRLQTCRAWEAPVVEVTQTKLLGTCLLCVDLPGMWSLQGSLLRNVLSKRLR